MEQDPDRSTWPNWLWVLMIVAMAVLLVLWMTGTWEVESEVKRGAGPGGVTFPANPGYEVTAPDKGTEEAVDVTLPAEEPAKE